MIYYYNKNQKRRNNIRRHYCLANELLLPLRWCMWFDRSPYVTQGARPKSHRTHSGPESAVKLCILYDQRPQTPVYHVLIEVNEYLQGVLSLIRIILSVSVIPVRQVCERRMEYATIIEYYAYESRVANVRMQQPAGSPNNNKLLFKIYGLIWSMVECLLARARCDRRDVWSTVFYRMCHANVWLEIPRIFRSTFASIRTRVSWSTFHTTEYTINISP